MQQEIPPASFKLAAGLAGVRIGVEASSLAGHRTGIGHATAQLLDALVAQWPANWAPLNIWANSPRFEVPEKDTFVPDPRIDYKRTRWPGRVLLRSWQYLSWPAIEHFVGPLDLVHSPASYLVPVRKARRVLSAHDLYFMHEPTQVEPFGGGYFKQTFKRGLSKIDHTIAVSQFTRDELLRFYKLDPQRITVIHHGVDRQRFSPETQDDDAAVLEKLGIQQPYLLCVSTIEPRKNLVTLVEAYARMRQILRAANQQTPRLVIAGLQGWGISAFRARLAEAHLNEGEVHATGYVPDDALPPLYRHALGLVFPSSYEGFGMPVVEAMACGCPMTLAEAGALPEIGGNAALYFQPHDSSIMAHALVRFITEPKLRRHLREAGFERVTQFKWETTARNTLDVYRRVLTENR